MKYIIQCSFLFLTMTGCKKDKSSSDILSAKLSPKALEYVMLETGKYFIYKDSATLSLDSVVVTKDNLQTIFVPKVTQNPLDIRPEHYSQQFDLVLTKQVPGVQTEWFDGRAYSDITYPNYSSNDTVTVNLIEYEMNGTSTHSTSAFYMQESQTSGLSVTIEGKTYNNVVITDSNNGYTDINDPFYYRTIYYWAKSVGIIKRTIITSGGLTKTYTLIRNG